MRSLTNVTDLPCNSGVTNANARLSHAPSRERSCLRNQSYSQVAFDRPLEQFGNGMSHMPEIVWEDIERYYSEWLVSRYEAFEMPPGDVRKITGRRIHTCRFDDEKGQCYGSGACEVCKSSSPFIHLFTIISIRNDISTAERNSSLTAPPLSPNGVNLVPHKR